MTQDHNTPLTLQATPDGLRFQLLTPMVETLADGSTVTVPEGFLTDFASVPQLLWNILPPQGNYIRAAVVHDWLYFAGLYSRKDTDKILLDGMIEDGVGAVKRGLIYAGVRIGGWYAWGQHRKMDGKPGGYCGPSTPMPQAWV